MAIDRAPSDLLEPSFVASRARFILGLVLVTIGAGAFAVAFRASLTAVYQTFYGADNIVDAIARLPRWLRLIVPVAAAAVAGSIARFRTSGTQGVSNVMEAIALGRVQLSLRDSLARCVFVGRNRRTGMSVSRTPGRGPASSTTPVCLTLLFQRRRPARHCRKILQQRAELQACWDPEVTHDAASSSAQHQRWDTADTCFARQVGFSRTS